MSGSGIRREVRDKAIAARSARVFDSDPAIPIESGPAVDFPDLVRKTPPAPLASWEKLTLGATGVVVAAALLGAIRKRIKSR